MIEVNEAKNGSLVFLKNGKYLASSFDPQKEAEAWWKNCERLTKNARTIFVLGLGCGYHIDVIKRENPSAKVIVIECDQDLVDLYNSKTSKPLEIVIESDWRKLLTNSQVAAGVQDRFAALIHPPSLNVEKDYFANAHKFLLARSVEGLFALLKQRPDLLAELDEAKLADLARSSAPVSIRTLTTLMKSTTYVNENRRLWKVLEELIA